jgi:hypothetical protein
MHVHTFILIFDALFVTIIHSNLARWRAIIHLSTHDQRVLLLEDFLDRTGLAN